MMIIIHSFSLQRNKFSLNKLFFFFSGVWIHSGFPPTVVFSGKPSLWMASLFWFNWLWLNSAQIKAATLYFKQHGRAAVCLSLFISSFFFGPTDDTTWRLSHLWPAGWPMEGLEVSVALSLSACQRPGFSNRTRQVFSETCYKTTHHFWPFVFWESRVHSHAMSTTNVMCAGGRGVLLINVMKGVSQLCFDAVILVLVFMKID